GAMDQTRPIKRIARSSDELGLAETSHFCARSMLRAMSFSRPGIGYAFKPPTAIAVWLIVLYSEGGRFIPLPSHRPSGIWRAMSQRAIVAVVVSSGWPFAANAICA